MSLINRVIDKVYIIYKYILVQYLLKKFDKKVFLIGTPWYGNLGDQAIVLAEQRVLEDVYKEYKIIDIPQKVYNSILNKCISFKIKKGDIIFLQGGGNLGSLYIQEENFRRKIIDKYGDNKIVIMPVSIFFDNTNFGNQELKKSQDVYNKHKNLTIISRDENSHNFSKKYFSNVKNILLPDIVMYLEGSFGNIFLDRKMILLFFRNDKEKILSKNIIGNIEKFCRDNKIDYDISDTIVPYEVRENNRKKEVYKKIKMIKSSKLVITDRFHGLIFSVITRTPAIVFKSFDNKIVFGIKWFEHFNWIHFIDSEKNISKIYSLIKYYTENNVLLNINEFKYQKRILNVFMKIKNEG